MKNGDIVVVKELFYKPGYSQQNITIGEKYELNIEWSDYSTGKIYWTFKDNIGWAFEYQLELLNNKINMENIKEKFVLALTSEPKKSFRKAGITNGDDLLTDEGQKVFLTWLLHSKYADEFKKDVVDGLLENDKKDN